MTGDLKFYLTPNVMNAHYYAMNLCFRMNSLLNTIRKVIEMIINGLIQAQPQSILKKRVFEAKARLNKLQPHLKKYPKVLDFGCGSGEFIDLMRDSGALASGFEPGNLYASYARDQKGLDVQNCGWDNYECKEKFDFVTAFHVFEHLTHPLKAFKKAISWLNRMV